MRDGESGRDGSGGDAVGPPVAPPVLGLLGDVQRRYGQQLVDQMTADGVPHTFAQSRVMGAIPADGIRLTDLGDRLGISKQSAGEIVDGLVADGYLVRRPDPADGRAKLIAFGPAGDASLATAWRGLAAVETAMAEVIGVAALERLRGDLLALLRATAT